MSVVRYLKNKLTKKGHVVSKFIFQPDQNKDYSDFELLEKSLNVMMEEGWVLVKENKDDEHGLLLQRKLSVDEFMNAIWEERF